MKMSAIARKCSLWRGLKTSPGVKGYRSSQLQRFGIELKGVKPEVLTLKALRPVQTGRAERVAVWKYKSVPSVSKVIEVKAVTMREVTALKYQRRLVSVLGPVAHFSCSTSGGVHSSERQFLAVVLKRIDEQRKALDSQEQEVRERIRQLPPDDDDQDSNVEQEEKKKKEESKPLFHEKIDEEKMAKALFEVYERYRNGKMFCKTFKPVDLMAYMFVMIARCGYGNEHFKTCGQSRFCEFFVQKVVPELRDVRGNTRKSMCNRLVGRLKNLLPGAPNKILLKGKALSDYEISKEKYDEIYGFFQETEYGKYLKSKFKKL